MLYDIMTVIIITLSIMPPAMLQYYAFEPLLTERKKRLVLGGYAVILLAELFFFALYDSLRPVEPQLQLL